MRASSLHFMLTSTLNFGHVMIDRQDGRKVMHMKLYEPIMHVHRCAQKGIVLVNNCKEFYSIESGQLNKMVRALNLQEGITKLDKIEKKIVEIIMVIVSRSQMPRRGGAPLPLYIFVGIART